MEKANAEETKKVDDGGKKGKDWQLWDRLLHETEETTMVQHLFDACLVVDALEPFVREELVNNFCSRELTSYEQIFEAAGAFNYC